MLCNLIQYTFQLMNIKPYEKIVKYGILHFSYEGQWTS